MKRTPSSIAISTAALGLGVTSHVSAHHSFTAEYDIKKPISMTGTVTKASKCRTRTPGSTSTSRMMPAA